MHPVYPQGSPWHDVQTARFPPRTPDRITGKDNVSSNEGSSALRQSDVVRTAAGAAR